MIISCANPFAQNQICTLQCVNYAATTKTEHLLSLWETNPSNLPSVRLASGCRDAYGKTWFVAIHFLKSVFFACMSPRQQELRRVNTVLLRWTDVQVKPIEVLLWKWALLRKTRHKVWGGLCRSWAALYLQKCIIVWLFVFLFMFEPFCCRFWMGTWWRCPVVASVVESEVDRHDTGQKAGATGGVAPPRRSPATQSPVWRVRQGWVLGRNMVFWEDFASEFCLAPHCCDMLPVCFL